MNKVIVAGSINMDIITRVAALPCSGETIAGQSVEYLPGGKGLNQAVACAKMETETVLVSCLGNDVFAKALADFLKRHHINTAYLKNSGKESGTAFINVADNGQNTIVVVAGSNADLLPQDINAVDICSGDIVISQFEIPLATVAAAFQKAKTAGARTLLNPSPIQKIPAQLLRMTDILILNETELGFLRGKNLNDDTPLEEIIAAAQKVKGRPDQAIIVTLGAKGALLIENGPLLIAAPQVSAVDTVGAGDCFAGVTASQLLKGKSLPESIAAAARAASICVTRKGAAPSMPCAAECGLS